jgi:hypothetical protein
LYRRRRRGSTASSPSSMPPCVRSRCLDSAHPRMPHFE